MRDIERKQFFEENPKPIGYNVEVGLREDSNATVIIIPEDWDGKTKYVPTGNNKVIPIFTDNQLG